MDNIEKILSRIKTWINMALFDPPSYCSSKYDIPQNAWDSLIK